MGQAGQSFRIVCPEFLTEVRQRIPVCSPSSQTQRGNLQSSNVRVLNIPSLNNSACFSWTAEEVTIWALISKGSFLAETFIYLREDTARIGALLLQISGSQPS